MDARKRQSDIGLARSGFGPLASRPPQELAQLDRETQGEVYGADIPGGGLGLPVDLIRYLVSLPGAAVGGAGAELAKTRVGEPAAQYVAGLLGGPADAASFVRDGSSSEPSVQNILALLRGHARGVFEK